MSRNEEDRWKAISTAAVAAGLFAAAIILARGRTDGRRQMDGSKLTVEAMAEVLRELERRYGGNHTQAQLDAALERFGGYPRTLVYAAAGLASGCMSGGLHWTQAEERLMQFRMGWH
jgi:hypothetical protein